MIPTMRFANNPAGRVEGDAVLLSRKHQKAFIRGLRAPVAEVTDKRS
jgi:hypothetical protein